MLEALEDDLARKKQKKFSEVLGSSNFFAGVKALLDVCNHCRVTPAFVKEKVESPQWLEEGCAQCRLQRKVGGKLPETEYLAYIYGIASDFMFPPHSVEIDCLSHLFEVTVVLLNKDEAKEVVQAACGRSERIILYRLNDTEFLGDTAFPKLACGFKFLANEAPRACKDIDPVKPNKEAIRKGEVLDFDEVASMSNGARLLGVIKADVDYLGSIFGLGVQPKSISRIATLSTTFDLFFSGWINRICEQLAVKWHNEQTNDSPLKGKVEGLFYIVYSGGDDMLILGPWDAIVDLARTIYAEFRAFTCYNENITLSGGILLVKPRFPIQRFAKLVEEHLEQSKTVGERQDRPNLNRKDRITLFGDTVRWRENEKGFDHLLDFGKKLAARVGEEKLPRSFIYFLMHLRDQHFPKEEEQNLMWVPKFHYALARRVTKEVIADKELNLQDNVARLMPHIRIPTSYVSLKLRRE
ncbi:MAG: hypothetical protein KKH04_12505 [Proteobacteria bacterium]|nr:hypothetical protein [Pseudomonadota bacterium]